MFYLPPEEFWYFTVARLVVEFDAALSGSGTGFYIYDGKNYFLVTARHVVDPSYIPKTKTRQAKIKNLDISFQCAINPGTANVAVGYQQMRVSDPDFIYEPSDVDVAVIKIPSDVLPIHKSESTVRPFSFPIQFLATDADLSTRYAGEPVVFVGFPDNAPVRNLGGTKFFYPILRQGVFAYPPVHGIDIDSQLGRNYGLIDSYAQSGFSGGPIITLQKGWENGSWHPKEEHRPPKVVGLVCGHYRSAQDRSDGGHAGISFYARSTAILAIIERIYDCEV